MANSSTSKTTINIKKNHAIQQKELKKWKKAVKSAVKDKKYTADMKELGSDDSGLEIYF